MPKKRLQFKDEVLSLPCEWNGCLQEFSDVDIYLDHISAHVQGKCDEIYVCMWEDCDSKSNEMNFDSLLELLRHVLFHGYHAKIKSMGANVLKRNADLGNCRFDVSSRNLVPDLPQKLFCGWQGCGDIFDNPEFFYRHVNSHVLQFKEPKRIKRLHCLWQSCTAKSFDELEKLRNHLRSHTQEKLVACPKCGCLFCNRTKFFDHIKRQASAANTDFTCNQCRKAFPSARLLKEHSRCHIFRYKCLYCDFLAATTNNMNIHIKHKHSNTRNYKCQFCDYAGKTEDALKRHLDTHVVNTLFECKESDCNYKVKNYGTLICHYKKKHLGKGIQGYACHLCDGVFSRGHYLTKHLLKKHKYKNDSQRRMRYQECDDGLFRAVSVEYKIAEPENQSNQMAVDEPSEQVNTPAASDVKFTCSVQNLSIDNTETIPTSILLEIKQADGTSMVCSCPIQYVSEPNVETSDKTSEMNNQECGNVTQEQNQTTSSVSTIEELKNMTVLIPKQEQSAVS